VAAACAGGKLSERLSSLRGDVNPGPAGAEALVNAVDATGVVAWAAELIGA
jgi:hypothetical protein